MRKQTLDKIGRACIVISILFLCVVVVRYTFHMLYPIVIAFLLAALLHSPITYLHTRYKIPRIASTLVILLMICALIVWAIVFVFAELVQGTSYLAEKIPTHMHFFTEYIEHFIQSFILPMYEKLMAFFSTLHPSHQETIEQNIYGFINQATEVVASFIQYILRNTPAFLSLLPHSIAMLGFISIATFLLVIDFQTYINQIKSIFPNNVRNHGFHVLTHIKKTLFGYIKAQLKIVLLTCVLLYIGLEIIHVKHAFTIVAFTALADLLPYVGTGIIFLPWIIYVFIVGHYELTIQLSIIYALVVVIRQIIEPKMISAHLNLRPITTLLALFIGFQLWGIIGMLLAPMTLIILTGIYQAGTFHLIWKYIMHN